MMKNKTQQNDYRAGRLNPAEREVNTMSNYAEIKKKIDKIRDWYGEFVFRGGISHLMDVGSRHLTKESVEETCKEIMQEDDTKQFMTNEFKCEIIKVAYELAQISQTDLIVYIQREMVYDIFDGVNSYQRAIDLLKGCMEQIEADENYDNIETLGVFESIGFDDDELEVLGFKYLIKEDEDENC